MGYPVGCPLPLFPRLFLPLTAPTSIITVPPQQFQSKSLSYISQPRVFNCYSSSPAGSKPTIISQPKLHQTLLNISRMYNKLALAAVVLSCVLLAYTSPLEEVSSAPVKAEEQQPATVPGQETNEAGEKVWWPLPASFSAMFSPPTPPPVPPPPPPPPPPAVIFIQPPQAPAPTPAPTNSSSG
ncbi:unnamed protein product [Allacma fusca]|uniref:Uncharacterized protein n=1 Tax=Allacma fusca TaxID=39272 RepID=A0A8J2JH91_9HEXA|nr:unnamed protein product [Allacma fusca]